MPDPTSPTPSRHAFVTGATGLLGSNLVRALLARGYRVTALSRSRRKAAQQLSGLPVAHVTGDLGNIPAFAASLRDVDVVFHTAAYFRDSYKGGSHRDALMDTNVRATRALLQASYEQGVRRMVFVSSIAVLDGEPGALIDETMHRDEARADDYYLSKILAEREVDQFLARHPDYWAACLLPGWMHGPHDAGPTSAGQMVADFLQRKLPAIPPGTVPVVDARDVAEAAISMDARGRRGERYLAAGRHTTMRDLLQALAQVSGVPAPRRSMPLAFMRLLAWASELGHRLTGQPVLISQATVRLIARENERTRFRHDKSERELGLHFRPMAETLRDEVDWLRAQAAEAANKPSSSQRRKKPAARGAAS